MYIEAILFVRLITGCIKYNICSQEGIVSTFAYYKCIKLMKLQYATK